MRRMFILFCVSAILFGIGMLVIFSDLTTALMFGLGYGAILTLSLGVLNYLSHKSKGELDSGVKQKKELDIPLSYADAFLLCKHSIASIKRAKVSQENMDLGIIEAKTGVNLSTWGDKIEFKVEKLSEEKSKVFVQSKPLVPTTLFDYGKNSRNIRSITDYIEEHVDPFQKG